MATLRWVSYAASPPTEGLLYTSTSGSHIIIPGKDTLRRQFNIPALQPGQSVSIVVKFTAPAGAYLVGADILPAGNENSIRNNLNSYLAGLHGNIAMKISEPRRQAFPSHPPGARGPHIHRPLTGPAVCGTSIFCLLRRPARYAVTFGAHDSAILPRALIGGIGLPVLLIASSPAFFRRPTPDAA